MSFHEWFELLKYWLSFGFGALIIALFASRRLELLTTFPSGEEFQIVRLLSTSAFVGRRAYRRAYIYYVVLLELIYLLFCTIEPLAVALFTPEALKQFKFNNVSWPFGSALVVVGLLPATPIIEQIELAFRGFAHRAAGIPEDFFQSVTRLERSQLPNTVEKEFSSEFSRSRTTTNILVASGFPIGEAQYHARMELLFGVFSNWTVAPQAATIWSASAKDKFGEILGILDSKVDRLRADLDQLVAYSLQTSYLKKLEDELKIVNWDKEISLQDISNSKTYREEEQNRKYLNERWDLKSKELGVIAKQLMSVFVIFAANDPTPSADKPLLREALNLAWREQSRPYYNASVIALLGAFLGCFLITTPLSTYLELVVDRAEIAEGLYNGIRSGVVAACTLIGQFGAALLVAISIRYSWEISLRYMRWEYNKLPPVSQSAKLLIYSSMAALAVSLMIYIIIQAIQGTLTAEKALNASELPMEMGFKVIWSLVPGFFAVGCTMIADSCEQGNKGWRPTIGFLVFTVAATFVLLVLNRNYDLATRAFWINMVGMVAFSTAGLLLFRSGAAQVRLKKPS